MDISPPKVKHVDEDISLIIITVEAAVKKHHWRMQRNGKLGIYLNIYWEHNTEKSLEILCFKC